MEGGERRRLSNEDAPSERLDMFGGENKIEPVASRRAFQAEQQSEQRGQGGSRRDQVWEEKRRRAMDRATSGAKKSMWEDMAKPPKFAVEDARGGDETSQRVQELAGRNRDGTGELDMLDQAYDQKSRKFPLHTRHASVPSIPEEEPMTRQNFNEEDARDRRKQEYAMELQAQMQAKAQEKERGRPRAEQGIQLGGPFDRKEATSARQALAQEAEEQQRKKAAYAEELRMQMQSKSAIRSQAMAREAPLEFALPSQRPPDNLQPPPPMQHAASFGDGGEGREMAARARQGLNSMFQDPRTVNNDRDRGKQQYAEELRMQMEKEKERKAKLKAEESLRDKQDEERLRRELELEKATANIPKDQFGNPMRNAQASSQGEETWQQSSSPPPPARGRGRQEEERYDPMGMRPVQEREGEAKPSRRDRSMGPPPAQPLSDYQAELMRQIEEKKRLKEKQAAEEAERERRDNERIERQRAELAAQARRDEMKRQMKEANAANAGLSRTPVSRTPAGDEGGGDRFFPSGVEESRRSWEEQDPGSKQRTPLFGRRAEKKALQPVAVLESMEEVPTAQSGRRGGGEGEQAAGGAILELKEELVKEQKRLQELVQQQQQQLASLQQHLSSQPTSEGSGSERKASLKEAREEAEEEAEQEEWHGGIPFIMSGDLKYLHGVDLPQLTPHQGDKSPAGGEQEERRSSPPIFFDDGKQQRRWHDPDVLDEELESRGRERGAGKRAEAERLEEEDHFPFQLGSEEESFKIAPALLQHARGGGDFLEKSLASASAFVSADMKIDSSFKMSARPQQERSGLFSPADGWRRSPLMARTRPSSSSSSSSGLVTPGMKNYIPDWDDGIARSSTSHDDSSVQDNFPDTESVISDSDALQNTSSSSRHLPSPSLYEARNKQRLSKLSALESELNSLKSGR